MKDNTQKLFMVTLKGMKYSASGVTHGVNYVVAKDPTEAYEIVRSFIDKENLGFYKDRELESVELIAE